MRWRDAFGLARRSVSRRPGRAVLTVLAVALAAALFTALLTISRTAETRVLNGLAKGGPLSGIRVSAAAANPSEAGQDNAKGQGRLDLTPTAIKRIRALPNVRSVIPVTGGSVALAWEDPLKTAGGKELKPKRGSRYRSPFATLVGFDIRRVTTLPVTVIAGRLPAPGALDEIALTPAMAARLGVDPKLPTEAVGVRLSIGSVRLQQYKVLLSCSSLACTLDAASIGSFGIGNRERYLDYRHAYLQRWTKVVVVGVVAQEAGPGEILASEEMVKRANGWGAALDTLEGGDRPSEVRGLFVVASDIDHVGEVRAAIAEVGYSTSAPENLIASVRRYLHVVEIVLGGIAAIALFIAALGICNALLAAIRERRREIGVLKAIGARDRDVRRVFLIEASVLGLTGGVLGTAMGLAFAAAVGLVVNRYLAAEGIEGVSLTVSLILITVAVAGSTLLATAAGVLPALRGARLPAREAVDA